MRADVIVLLEPRVDNDLGLSCCHEPLRVKHLATQRAVELLVAAIFPGRAWMDPDRFDADTAEPILERCG